VSASFRLVQLSFVVSCKLTSGILDGTLCFVGGAFHVLAANNAAPCFDDGGTALTTTHASGGGRVAALEFQGGGETPLRFELQVVTGRDRLSAVTAKCWPGGTDHGITIDWT
jgi:hypothetical protein